MTDVYRFPHGRMILASASPRRTRLLREMGVPFDVSRHNCDENGVGEKDPGALAVRLATDKALDVSRRMPGYLVMGADTVVAVDGEVLGKPVDREDAFRMLRLISRTRHRVITGVCLALDEAAMDAFSDTTFITMRPMSEDEIRSYVESGEPFGKAGAYAIQETADRFVERVEGSFSNVVGLPTEALADRLSSWRRG